MPNDEHRDGITAGQPPAGLTRAAAPAGRRRARRHRGRFRCADRLSDDLGAEHQGHHAAPCRAAGRRDPENRRTGEQGSRLHDQHAGDRKRRPAQPLPVAIERDRCRRRQHHLYEIPGRPQRVAGDPGQQGQGLGQDHPAVHEGRLPGRQRSLDAGRGAVHGPVCDRTGRTEIRQGSERVADRNPDHHQCRHARHPPRSGRPAGQQLGRSAEPRVQGQGGAAGPADGRRHRCRDGARGARRRQIRQQGQYDPRRDRQDHRHDDRHQEIRPLPLVLDEFRPVGEPDGLGRGR